MTGWLEDGELRIGLGCMRLPAEGGVAEDTIAAALAAGITVFDTARAYAGNEALLARTLRGTPARIVTKGGMTRIDGRWVPDGRAKTIRADCEASLDALDGLPIDLYLAHAPDPRVPWRTTVRALARLVDAKLVRRIGVCNVNRVQLDEALALAPLAAVQVALSVLDDRALRGGILERCVDAGLTLIAHSPLGSPRRAPALARQPALAEIASAHDATPAEVALAWLLDLAPQVVAIPGARSPEAVRSVAGAASLELRAAERVALAGRRPTAKRRDGEVVLVMGIPGAGKSRLAEALAAEGHVRLNRDERGGSLRALAEALDEALESGETRVVLDNTYLTRASRSHVLDAAARHGVAVRCVWLDTPLAQAQVNLVERVLDLYGRLPTPDELRANRSPAALAPTSQLRAARELEPPSADEGFAQVERVEFVRSAAGGRAGVFVAAAALRRNDLPALDPEAPRLVFDWRPDGVAGDGVTICPHPAGPPVCWCRPPLPGLVLEFARRHGVDPSRSVLVGTSRAHRALAETLGARVVILD